MTEDQIHKHINEDPDSVEWGSAAKGTHQKVYGDYSQPEKFRKKISEALELRKWLTTQLQE